MNASMRGNNVESIFPLTDAQRALLLHSVRSTGSDPGLIQVQCTLEGNLDPATFAEGWRAVTAHHPCLRTAVVWEDVDQPVHVVLRSVDPEIERLDWRGVRDHSDRFTELLQGDRNHRLDLGRPPTMRIRLIRLEEEKWRMLWTCHHVLLDGWSGATVTRDVLSAYCAIAMGGSPQLDPAPPFKKYADWLNRQAIEAAEQFWREQLRGFTAPTPIGAAPEILLADSGPGTVEYTEILAGSERAALAETARRASVTLGVLLQGAWALALSGISGERDVVFGTTVSGRAVGPPGMDRMVGMCANTLPVRALIQPEASLGSFLDGLRQSTARARPFEYVPPGRLQAWSEIPLARRLYDSLLVIETLPSLQDADFGGNRSPVIKEFRGGVTSNFPLTLIVVPGDTLELNLLFDRRRFEHDWMAKIARGYGAVLRAMPSGLERSVGDLLEVLRTSGSGFDSGASSRSVRTGRDGLPSGNTASTYADQTTSGSGYIQEGPADDVERRLVAMWEDVLQVSPVGVLDDFFDLGGQSIAAAHLFDRIERELRVKLPLATLFELSTIRKLADALRTRGWSPSWKSLVRMGGRGTHMPLFCVHSWAGNVLFYRDFVRHLPTTQPVYALQAIGLDGSALPPRSIPEIAGAYLSEIREICPHGPYALLGMCFGNAVVLEMASQLKADGERVAALFILDSSVRSANLGARDARQIARRISEAAEQGELLSLMQRYVARKSATRMQRYRRAWYRSKQRLSTRSHDRPADPFHEALRAAWTSYVPVPFDGRIVFIRSRGRAADSRYEYEVRRWAEFAIDGLDVEIVSGEHLTFMNEPHVGEVAAVVQAHLDRAHEAARRDRYLSPDR